MSPPVAIAHYSDVLCVWAYIAQIRIDELRHQFGDRIAIETRFCSVFPDARGKLSKAWAARGGFPAYRAHVESVVARFDHVALHADVWAATVPTTSATAHACIKAAAIACDPGADVSLAWQLRLAFFRDGRDISRLEVQLAVAEELGLSSSAIRAQLDAGTAWAAVLHDYEDAVADRVMGSPTLLLNERRQTLYGNVGYKIIEANVLELLEGRGGQASWC